jgi:nucleoside-diphosphate-sugar epimerase
MRALVTGATGFVGRVLCARLAEEGITVRAAVRDARETAASETAIVGSIDDRTQWERALDGVDVVFHLAAVAHITSPTQETYDAMRRINAGGTANLARAARSVPRFVYVSTAKVSGESSGARPFRESDPAAPEDPYGVSKWEGEQAVRAESPSYTIVRPPLVYGPGVRANFLSLIRLVDRGLPLPLGRIDNRRSLVYTRNLADALVHAARSEAAHNETFFVSDGEDVSTAELVRRIARALGKRPRLLPVPPALLRLGATLARRPGAFEKIAGNLQVDSSAIRATRWKPPFTLDEGLAATAEWYRKVSS